MLTTLHIKPPTKLLCYPKISRGNHRSFSLTATESKPLNRLRCTQCLNLYGPLRKNFHGFSSKPRGLVPKAQDESDSVKQTDDKSSDGNEIEARGESTMPERFRYLTKEGPDKPVRRWPLLIVLAAILYLRTTVIRELANWRKAVTSIVNFFVYILKLLLALIFQFIGSPLTSLIRGIETTLYTIRAFYSSIIAYAPIKELTLIIVLTSTILSISEAAAPGSVNGQPYLLTMAGLIGFLAVRSSISELFFWILLVGLFCYARIVKRRDYVSSALPVAAVLTAVGEPWVRVIVMSCYVALAVGSYHESREKSRMDGDSDTGGDSGGGIRSVPIPLLCAALAIGIRVAAKWAGYRHLTWMIV